MKQDHMLNVLRRATLVVSLLVVAGCGSPRSHYMGAVGARERNALELASPAPAATLDTQETYLKLVSQMQQEGLWFASLAHIEWLEKRWGTSPRSIRARADALRHIGQHEASLHMYRRLMGTPLEASGYHGLGLLAGGRSDFSEAAQMFEKARMANPTDAIVLSDLGYAYLRSGRITQARIPLMQALQLRPADSQIQANLSLYLLANGEPGKAIDLMEMNRMPAGTQAAIRELAGQLANASAAGREPTGELTTPPLMLKTSSWTGLHAGTKNSLSEGVQP